jgi:hypothetical protein
LWFVRRGQFTGWSEYLYTVQAAFLIGLLYLVARK